MSSDDSHYFYVLHQIEFDFNIDHDELLSLDKNQLFNRIDKWFERRSNISGVKRTANDDFKEGVFNWKEVERELEES